MFALYCKAGKSSKWNFELSVSIAGVIAGLLQEKAAIAKPKNPAPMPWELTGVELREAVMKASRVEGRTDEYKLIIDATWGRADAQLLEIMRVVGYSYEEWTPLMLQVAESAVVKVRPKGPATPVETVDFDEPGPDSYIHEFLYLQCGYVPGKGRRTWGRMGYTNAALLWPDAFEYLLSRAGFEKKRALTAAR